MTRPVHIDQRAGVVTKPVDQASLMCEVRMTQSAHELAQGGSLFRVPEVVGYDLSEQWIKLEYIDGTVPLHHLLRSKTSPIELFERAARIVAQVHRHLELDQKYVVPLPPKFDRDGPKSFMHGDLNLVNLRYRAATDELVLIDWSPSPLIGVPANWGTVYWDVAFFLRSIIVAPPIRWMGRQARHDLADAFLQRYVADSGNGPLARPFYEYCLEMHSFFAAKEKRHLKTWYRYLRYWALSLNSFQQYIDRRTAGGREFS